MSSSSGDHVKSTLTWTSAATREESSVAGRNTSNPDRALSGSQREVHHNAWANDSLLSTSLTADGPLADRVNRRGMSCGEGEAVTLAQQQDFQAFTTHFGSAASVASSFSAFDAKSELNLTFGKNARAAHKRRQIASKSADHLAAINEALGRDRDAPIDASVIESQRRIHTDTAIRRSGSFTTVNESSGTHRDACTQCQQQIMTRMHSSSS